MIFLQLGLCSLRLTGRQLAVAGCCDEVDGQRVNLGVHVAKLKYTCCEETRANGFPKVPVKLIGEFFSSSMVFPSVVQEISSSLFFPY